MSVQTANQNLTHHHETFEETVEKISMDPFDVAVKRFYDAINTAENKGGRNDAVQHALKVLELIKKMRQDAPKVQSQGYQVYSTPNATTKDAELIQHLNSTAELVTADKGDIQKVRNYVASAKALNPTHGALKGAMLAFAGAIGTALGIGLLFTGAGAHVGLGVIALSAPALISGCSLFRSSLKQEEALHDSANKLCHRGPVAAA